MGYQPFDREAFIACVNRRRTKFIRGMQIASLTGAICYSIAFGILLLSGNPVAGGMAIAAATVLFLLSLQSGDIMTRLDEKFRYCPRCEAPLPGQLVQWNTGESRAVQDNWIVASGCCPNCQEKILSGTPPEVRKFRGEELHGACLYSTWVPGLFLLAAGGTGTLFFFLTIAGKTEYVHRGIPFLIACLAFFFCRRAACRRRLPCPHCGGNLKERSLEAVAGATGGCGICGAAIVIDPPEIKTVPPPQEEQETERQKRKRLADIPDTVIFIIAGLLFLGAGASILAEPAALFSRSAGTVTGIFPERTPKCGEYAVSCTFPLNGKTYPAAASLSYPQARQLAPGAPVEIIYWRGRPDLFHRLGEQKEHLYLSAGLFFLLFGFGWLLCAFVSWKFRGCLFIYANGHGNTLKPGHYLDEIYPDDASCGKS